jgi:polysaccharide pyruvyl transferase WcaK-like protein
LLKSVLRNGVSQTINVIGRARRTIAATPELTRHTCLLAPAWQGSLGDQAVITAAVQHLRANGADSISLIGFDQTPPWENIADIDNRIAIPDFFKTGGWPERWQLTRDFLGFDRFYLLGTDMLDGHYTGWHTDGLLKIARQAATSGLPTNAVGFSLKDRPLESAVQGLRGLAQCRNTTMCVRDQVSLTRYHRFVGSEAVLTADPAFLLEPDGSPHRSRDWLQRQASENGIRIGLNLSSHVYDGLSESEQEQIVVAIRESVRALSAGRKNVTVLLIPHDIRKDFDDLRLCQLLYRAIGDLPGIQAHVMEPPYSPGIIKSMVAELDFVLSSRMHLAIACLGAGTPVGCITYQGKFEGLFQHFGIFDCTISPEDALSPSTLQAFVLNRVESRAMLASRISDALVDVTRLSERNFRVGAE